MQLTIRQKLVLYVFLPFVLLSLLLLSVNVFTIRRQVLTTIEDNLNQQARQYATNIDAALRAVANIASNQSPHHGNSIQLARRPILRHLA